MGGGTPLLEANRVGCDVQGFDINPMAAWIVKKRSSTSTSPHTERRLNRCSRRFLTT